VTTPILVVGTDAASMTPARFARPLAKAGASVSVLVPDNAPARHTRHVVRVGLVPAGAPAALWTEALFALLDVAAPRAIVPADAGALDFLTGLVLAPPPALRPERVGDLARRLDDALGPADRWPASLAPDRGTALPGAGDAFLAGAGADAPSACAATAGDRAQDRAIAVVDRRVEETRYTHHVAAHRGRVLASATAEHVVVDERAGRRPTVLRFCAHEAIAERAARAIGALEASGCCALDLVVGADGEPRIVAIDRHVVPATHMSQWLGVDLAAAWLAALDGREGAGATALPTGTSRYSVAFPQEWQRDSASPWLRGERVDVPWDDAPLLDAILGDAVAAAWGAGDPARGETAAAGGDRP
jgi:hypothetical protein